MKSLFSHFNASMIFLTTDGRDCHVELEDDSQVGTAWGVLVHIAGRTVRLSKYGTTNAIDNLLQLFSALSTPVQGQVPQVAHRGRINLVERENH